MIEDFFTDEEIQEFKGMRFPWMEDRFVSPVCITFNDNLYGNEYQITKTESFFVVLYHIVLE